MRAISIALYIAFAAPILAGIGSWFYAVFHFAMAIYAALSALPDWSARLRAIFWPPLKNTPSRYVRHRTEAHRAVVVFMVVWLLAMTVGNLAMSLPSTEIWLSIPNIEALPDFDLSD